MAWFPHVWRNYLTDLLLYTAERFHPYDNALPRLKQALAESDCHELVDLCSGGAGPLLRIERRLEREEDWPVRVTLTDKYPNLEAFRRAAAQSGGKIGFVESPVDAMNVPPELNGFRTLFTSFHHFPPEAAKKILADAARKGVGIGVFEITQRRAWMILATPAFPLLALLLTAFIRPFTWRRFLWTYVIPVMPVIASWDGMISNLRSYSPAELGELVREIPAENYKWEIGSVPILGPGRVTYLIVTPASRAFCRT
ncbi:MAG: class I SAM-dependent methyltransferase [Acidobacteria bacterium]|nr:class I SAM-dependent methyltransferase [Acidobacteriota bacterium]